MAAKTFIRRVAGVWKEVLVTVVSAGAASAGEVAGLDDTGRLDQSLMPAGLGADVKAIVASEALSAGNLVSLYSNAGTINARKADATAEGKPAVGFVLAAVSSGGTATVYFSRIITGLTGLTVGARYYLSTTPGGVVTVEPSGAGVVGQYVGTAISTTELQFEPDDYVVKAA